MVVEWFLQWRTVPLFAMSVLLVASNNPWGTADIVLPGGGETLAASTTTIVTIVGVFVILYHRFVASAGWRVLLVPLGFFLLTDALALADLIRILSFAADSEEEWSGLLDNIQPTNWIWTAVASTLLGTVSTAIQTVDAQRHPPLVTD
jgi:hypothetical protein